MLLKCYEKIPTVHTVGSSYSGGRKTLISLVAIIYKLTKQSGLQSTAMYDDVTV